MGDSLQDQLRALGLAKKPEARKRNRPGGKPRAKPSGGNSRDENGGNISLARAFALREKEETRKAERARARKQAEDRQRREINKKIRGIVKEARLNADDAEVARHFMFRGRIRKVYVTPDQNRALSAGEMGLVYLTGGYHLVDAATLETVREIAADHVVELPQGSDGEDEFPVPDDLEW